MKKLVLLFCAAFIMSCGKDGNPGANGHSCSVTDDGFVKCTDGSVYKIPAGEDGKDGKNGAPGKSYTDELNIFLDNTSDLRDSILDVVFTDGSSTWRGTGTKIEGDKILTAHHVTDGAIACEYYSSGTKVGGGGNGTQQEGNLDIAYINSPNWNSIGNNLEEVVVDSTHTFEDGEMLLLLSHPSNFDDNLQTTIGHVASVDLTGDLGSYSTYWKGAITTSLIAYQGSSGGPIFNKEGEITAILVGGHPTINFDLTFILPL